MKLDWILSVRHRIEAGQTTSRGTGAVRFELWFGDYGGPAVRISLHDMRFSSSSGRPRSRAEVGVSECPADAERQPETFALLGVAAPAQHVRTPPEAVPAACDVLMVRANPTPGTAP